MRKSENKEKFWRRHVTGVEEYAGSHEAYCRAEGISAPALWYWRKKVAFQGCSKGLKRMPDFVPVEIMNSSGSGLPDPRWLAELILCLSGGGR